MVSVAEKKIKGNRYVYLVKSVRAHQRVLKMSKFLGRKESLSLSKIAEEKKKFMLDSNQQALSLIMKEIRKKYSLIYPFTEEELLKLEEMNLQYKEIRRSLHKNDWTDLKKRFVANFVFESNALEGNSLTLKNFSEIIFEQRISASADLREVYDAQNSYKVFSTLFNARSELSEELIITIHQQIMKNIDDRFGYKKFPNILLGRNLQLTDPKDTAREMKELLLWYHQHQEKIYPLELAFLFHHRFEKIHPFADGNGRVGRMLLNYILIKKGYYPIIIRRNQREKYLKALEAADSDRYIPLQRFMLEKSKETYRKFFEVYYHHLKK